MDYIPGQSGRGFDVVAMQNKLLPVLTNLHQARVELPLMTILPLVYDDAETVVRIQNIISGEPITFYLQEPLAVDDLRTVTLPAAKLARWIRVELDCKNKSARPIAPSLSSSMTLCPPSAATPPPHWASPS